MRHLTLFVLVGIAVGCGKEKAKAEPARPITVFKLETIEPGCVIAMEACTGAHHWARKLQAQGFTVKLIAPQFVKQGA